MHKTGTNHRIVCLNFPSVGTSVETNRVDTSCLCTCIGITIYNAMQYKVECEDDCSIIPYHF